MAIMVTSKHPLISMGFSEILDIEVNLTCTLVSPQMSINENSQAILAASQPISAVLIKNLSNLTLNPSSKLLSTLPEYSPQQTGWRLNLQEEEGGRALLIAWRERMERNLSRRMLRLNQEWKDLDVAVIIACIIEILLRIIMRIITTTIMTVVMTHVWKSHMYEGTDNLKRGVFQSKGTLASAAIFEMATTQAFLGHLNQTAPEFMALLSLQNEFHYSSELYFPKIVFANFADDGVAKVHEMR
ncbi:hypothetical protein EI555_005471, partial [Monodon monoceros]